MRFVLGAVVTAALLTAAPATAQDKPTVQQLLPRDVSFCFARDYDARHLASNPAQQVMHIRVGARAGWNVHGQRDLPYHDITISLVVRTRAAARTGVMLASCTDYPETNEPGAERGLHCSLVCAGDKVVLDARDAGTLILRNRGLRAGCRGPRIGGGADAVFHLRRQPLSVCPELDALPPDEGGIGEVLRKAREGL